MKYIKIMYVLISIMCEMHILCKENENVFKSSNITSVCYDFLSQFHFELLTM